MEYSYTKSDLFKEPTKYQYSTYLGDIFITQFTDQRFKTLEKLGEISYSFDKVIEEIKAKTNTNDYHSKNEFLKLILGTTNVDFLDKMVKKFEVFRRIFTDYSSDYRKISEDYEDFEVYILFSYCCLMSYKNTENLKYFNASLKCLDMLTSRHLSTYSPIEKSLLSESINLENKMLNKLVTKLGLDLEITKF